jgi:hypothetical protein
MLFYVVTMQEILININEKKLRETTVQNSYESKSWILALITQRFMNRRDRVEVQLQTLTSALDRGHLSASRAGRFISGERNPFSQ